MSEICRNNHSEDVANPDHGQAVVNNPPQPPPPPEKQTILFAFPVLSSRPKVYFDWDAPRSREGYFKLKGGVDYCIARSENLTT